MRFRKKPVEVEAWQVTQEFLNSLMEPERFRHTTKEEDGSISMLESFVKDLEEVKYRKLYAVIREDKATLFIRTLEGDMEAKLGDWIITGVEGEIYPCKPLIFEKTYEKVE
jgi:hypothetical protein